MNGSFTFGVGYGTGRRSVVTFSRIADLELGKINKNLLQIRASHREVLNSVSLEQVSQFGESLGKGDIAALDVDAVDTIADFDG